MDNNSLFESVVLLVVLGSFISVAVNSTILSTFLFWGLILAGGYYFLRGARKSSYLTAALGVFILFIIAGMFL